MEDRYFCEERLCNSFVDKNHRCEQWSNAVRIPAGAIEAIRAEALRDAADRAVKHIKTTYNPVLDAYVWKVEELRAAILGGEVKV
jgi:hypothetical protein